MTKQLNGLGAREYIVVMFASEKWERFLTKPEGSWGSSQSGAASREIVVMALAISLIQIWWIWADMGTTRFQTDESIRPRTGNQAS